MANKEQLTATPMYYMKTQWNTYAKCDSNGWLTYTNSQGEADLWKDFLNGGNPDKLYIRCMSGNYSDYYLSADWEEGMGVWSQWVDAAYWKWKPVSDGFNFGMQKF